MQKELVEFRYRVAFKQFSTSRRGTRVGTNISPTKALFEEDVPFLKVGYVSSLGVVVTLAAK